MKTLNDLLTEDSALFHEEMLILRATELVAMAMEQEHVSKAELARRLNKSKAFVTQCLNGGRNLTLRTLADLLAALGKEVVLETEAIESFSNQPERKKVEQIFAVVDNNWHQTNAWCQSQSRNSFSDTSFMPLESQLCVVA